MIRFDALTVADDQARHLRSGFWELMEQVFLEHRDRMVGSTEDRQAVVSVDPQNRIAAAPLSTK